MEEHNNNGRRERPLRSEEVLQELNPIIPAIYEAIERAIGQAKEFFSENKPIDPFLFPNLVRYHALEFLETLPREVDALTIERLSNNGICILFKDYRMRIWKADEGELPAAGSSGTRVQFFEQPALFPYMRIMKLAIIWDTTSKGTLQNLLLVCPKGDGNPCNQPGQLHWQKEIPHPATAITATAVFDSGVIEDIDLEPPSDFEQAPKKVKFGKND